MPSINGTNGNDSIDVTNDDGTLNGNSQGSGITNIDGQYGDDTISVTNSNISNDVDGGNGDDAITITDSNVFDDVDGESGNDTINITGSTVGDDVTGSLGDDSITITNSTIEDDVRAGHDNDTIVVTNSTIEDDIEAGYGDDQVIVTDTTILDDIRGGYGDDYVDFSGSSADRIDLGADNDTIDFADDSTTREVRGGSGVDQLNLPGGTVVNDAIYGTFTVVSGTSYNLSQGTFTLPSGTSVNYLTFEGGAGFPCFAQDTTIETASGPRKVQSLQVGDMIETTSNGLQQIAWMGRRVITSDELRANPKLRPVRITAGALGNGLPRSDLLVSRQHRMLVASRIAERMFGTVNVLVAAIKLTALPGIYVDEEVDEVEYFHLLFEQHEVIYAEGAPSESLYTGAEALKMVSHALRTEIFEIFPELADDAYVPEQAHLFPTGQKQKQLLARHAKNEKPLLELFDPAMSPAARDTQPHWRLAA